MPESIISLFKDNWLIFIIVYLVKPDLVYGLLNGMLSKLGVQPSNPDDVKPEPNGPPGLLSTIELLAELFKRNLRNNTKAEPELQAVMSKMLKVEDKADATK